MALNADDFIQETTGSQSLVSQTTFTVTVPSGTTAGNTVLFLISSMSAITPPAGVVLDKSSVINVHAFRSSDVAGSVTSWIFTVASSTQTIRWYVAEVTGLGLTGPLDVSVANNNTIGNGGTLTVTAPLNAGLSTVAFAVFASATTDGSWSGYTGGFEEISDVPGGSGQYGLAVSRQFVDGTTTTFACTATLAIAGSAQSANAVLVVYMAADSPIAAPLEFIAGFEQGTHAGMGQSSSPNLGPLGCAVSIGATGWGTAYLVQAGSARNGSYGLRIVQAAGTLTLRLGSINVGNGASYVSYGFNVRVVSGTGTPVVAQAGDQLGSTIHAQLVYDTSTTKFGVRCGTTGTVSYESGTTALNTWRWIDLRVKTTTATWTADWRIETGTDTYTDQTQATLGGQSLSLQYSAHLGRNASQTVTADFDDLVISRYGAAYPLGPHVCRILVPETTGATVSGTSTNFSRFTANGTLAAVSGTEGALLDDVPPTISASADGVVQTAVAASDYLNLPMATYTCASDEVIAAVRALFPEWGGTGTGTGTIGYRGYDGTTETTFVAASASYDADSLTTASSTYPLWKCVMWSSVNGWTQTELNAAALRVGFSTDATPDMGIHAAYLEVAVRKGQTVRQLSAGENDEFTVDIVVHPYTSATVSYVITNDDATRTAAFNYSLAGTPQDPFPSGIAPSSSQTVQINAAAFGDVSDLVLGEF